VVVELQGEVLLRDTTLEDFAERVSSVGRPMTIGFRRLKGKGTIGAAAPCVQS